MAPPARAYPPVPAVPAMAPAPPPGYGGTVRLVTAKSPGIAVLLSFLWLGAGHLYVGQIGAGIALIVLDFFLALLSFTVFGLLISIPVWLIAFVIVAILAARAAKDFNYRNGIVVN